MVDVKRAFTQMDSGAGIASSLPYLPLTLIYRGHSFGVSGLLDTGATVNVLPYNLGLQLGAVWEEQTTPVQLTGNLAQLEARVLILSAIVDEFPTVAIAFAWRKATQVPLILGQINFFLEFDVCFYRSQAAFEVRPKQAS